MALTAARAKRLVFHIGGFDPTPPARMHGRFVRELRRFKETWCLTLASVSEPESGPDQAAWNITTTGPNWVVDTRYCFVRWDDVVDAAASRPMGWRIPLGLLACLDFIWSCAFWGYLRTNWRYAGFFMYPFLVLALFAAIGYFSAASIASATGSAPVGAAAGLVTFAGLLRWPGRRMYLPLLLDDWIFSSEYVRRGNPILEQRLDRIAQEISTAVHAREFDEVAIIGHSLGAVLAIDLLDRVLTRDSALGQRGTRLALLSVGSSILKIGLHRKAIRFRAALERVGEASGVFWGEYQALSDVMNFYKCDPMAVLNLTASGRPVVRLIRISRMLKPDAYRRVRRNLYRLHCQFISGNDRRAAYDYFMLLCGPLSVERQVRSPDGAVSAMGPDGTLLPETPHEPAFDCSQQACGLRGPLAAVSFLQQHSGK